jgi:predicted DNA-binding transcriptional regulator YafY
VQQHPEMHKLSGSRHLTLNKPYMKQKRPFFRYKVINRCLKSKTKRYWSMEDFLKKLLENDLVVNLRTLRRDIYEMRYDQLLGFNAPIAFSRKNGGYYYTDESFSIELEFGPAEFAALRTLLKFIERAE